MRRRSHRRDLVVWSSSSGLDHVYARGFPVVRRRRIWRWVRVGPVLMVMGVMRLARVARMRWRTGLLVSGLLLTVIGIVAPGSSMFVPGLVILIFALLQGSPAPNCRAAAQMTGMRWRG